MGGTYLSALPGQQRIHHCSGTQQLADRGQAAGRLWFRRAGYLRVEIRPTPRHQGLGAVGQDQNQVQPAMTTHPAVDRQPRPEKGMVLATYAHRLRKVLEVGSVSGLPWRHRHTTPIAHWDVPWSARRRLFGGDEAVADPAMEGGGRNAEDLGGSGNGQEFTTRLIGAVRLIARDAAVVAQT